MTAYASLSPLLRALAAEWTTLLLILSAALIVRDRQSRRSTPTALTGGALLALSYLLLQYQLLSISVNTGVLSPDGRSVRFSALPAAALFLILLALTALCLVLLLRIARWKRRHITLMSVKEGIDQLDSGLCCCWPDGVVKLANPRMQALCRAITGQSLRNGAAFWETLRPSPIRTLPDGSVWSFSRRELTLEEGTLYELTAVDVTREYALTEALQARERELADYNRRLRDYGAEADEVGVQEEMLAMKLRIHDQLGQALLSSRRHLESPPASLDQARSERQRIGALWQEAIRMGVAAGSRQQDETLRSIADAGAAVGIRVELDGALPPEGRAMRLLTAGARTALTNAYRHAGATALTIRVRTVSLPGGRERVEIAYQNNGAAPAGPVTEGGGLTALRQTVERQGGQMWVYWHPVFTLTITLE
ncbi:MAG: hypothetical protein IJ221_03895 [Oscillibacter sp.]|nr:hypothetical protein [Oscillibacter sp.]